MRYTFATLAVIAVALIATAAVGQDTSPIVAVGSQSPNFPYSPPEAWHHSSTALEGALRGTAVLTQAQGAKNLMDSQARVFNEHARSLAYDHDLKFTVTQFQIKETKKAYRDLERQRVIQRRLEGRDLHDERDLGLAETYRLTDYEFNWATGSIYWPTWVASPRFAAQRHRIAVIVDQMYRYDLAGDKFYREELVRACDTLRDQLRDDAKSHKELTVEEYLRAQRFLVGLKYMPHLLEPSANLVAMNGR
jgi:hypothetical protein